MPNPASPTASQRSRTERETNIPGHEVSCRVVIPLLSKLDEEGRDVTAMLAGTGYTVEHLKDSKKRMSWDGFRTLMSNIGSVLSDDELVELGKTIVDSVPIRPSVLMARLLFSVQDFYRWDTERLMTQNYTCVRGHVYESGAQQLRLEFDLLPGYEPCREWYLCGKGNLIALPTALGLRPATVEMTETETGVRYTVQLPSAGGGLRRLVRQLSRPFAARATARQLQHAYEDLSTRYWEMEKEAAARTQAEQALQQRYRELEMLNRAGQVLSSSLELDQVLIAVLEEVRHLFDVTASSIWLIDPETDEVVCRHAVGPGNEIVRGWRLPSGQGIVGWVAQHGESTIVGDAEADERYYAHVADRMDMTLRSILSVPLEVQDRVIGVLQVLDIRADRLGEKDQALIEPLAASAAIAIDNARLHAETHERLREQIALREAGAIISSALEPETVLSRIVEQMGQVVNATSAYISGYDPGTGQAVVLAEYISPAACAQERVSDLGKVYEEYADGQWMAAMRSGQHRVSHLDDPDLHEIERSHMKQYGARTILYVPLLIRDELIGYVEIWESRRRREFTPGEVALCQDIAQQAAIALENARLYEQAQREIAERRRAEEALERRVAQLEAINRIWRNIASVVDQQELLQRAVDSVREDLGYPHVAILLIDPGMDELFVATATEDFWAIIPSDYRQPIGKGAIGMAAQLGETVLVTDAATDSRTYQVGEWFSSSSLSVPIKIGGSVIGVLEVEANVPSAFDENDVIVLDTVGDQVAVAIQNTRLYEEAQRSALEQETLREASLALTTTLERNEVVDRILAQLQEVVPYDTASVQLLRGELLEIVGGRGFPNPEKIIGLTFDPHSETNPNREVVRTWAPYIVADGPAVYDEFSRDPHAPAGIRSWLGVPMIVGEQLIGMIALDKTVPGFYTAEHARLAEAFAAQAAIAIENARLYQALRGHAHQLEQRVQERTAELQAQYARLDAILRSTTDGIVVTDEIGNIVQANPVVQAWLNRTLSPADADRLRKAVRDLAWRADETPELVLELTGLDLELSAGRILEEGVEEPSAVVVAIHDVSHLKALDRMKTRFVSNVSHELRTPITTIKLYTHLMQLQPEKHREYLGVLAYEADNQARLVEDILQISRIDAGRMEMEPMPTSLDRLVKAVVVSHRVMAEDGDVTLEYRSGGSELTVLVDPNRMIQVLNNLVSNAIRYTLTGGSVIVSIGEQMAEGRKWATITVADTGMGIPATEMPHIFDRFFRGKRPREMQLTGTGLGLSIVQEIVEFHGGRVEVESEENVGSIFTVWLPLAD
jgi:GAF domain-containing protein/nitrogen-specific signal transduction histidine kinase